MKQTKDDSRFRGWVTGRMLLMPLIETQNQGERLGLEGKNDDCIFLQIEVEVMTNHLRGDT